MSTTGTTYAQHAVWFTEQAGVAGRAYHMGLGIWFDGGLDRPALRAACAAVAARHPVLGRVVEAGDGSPRLVSAGPGPVLVVDEVSDGRFDERLRDELARPFDLARGPLARFTLLAGPADRHLLVFTAHHLVFDGMSKDVLVRDLAAGYRAALDDTRAVPEHPATPDHQATPERDETSGAAGTEPERVEADLPAARKYWQRRWTGPGEPILPDLTRRPEQAEPGAVVEFELPAALAEGIGRTAAEVAVTRFELLLAALHILLHRYGATDCPIGVGLSTRTPATAGEIGLFVNELPVHPPEVTGTFREYARSVRAGLRELYRFRTVPFGHAVAGLRPAPALTTVSLGYRRRAADPVFPGTTTSVLWTLFAGGARNALHVQVVDGPAGITVGLQHSPAAITTDAVRRIGEHLRTLLSAAVVDPDQAVAALPILPAAELSQVTGAWTGTARDWSGDLAGHEAADVAGHQAADAAGHPAADVTDRPAGADVLTRFAARVREHPDAVAVVDEGRSLTYAELDRASRELAGRLAARGVGRGNLVAVGLDRSWNAVVALLAVLRRAAAYLPVDPAQPAARQALILTDAAPTLVLTTKSLADALDPALPTLTLDESADLVPLTDEATEPPAPIRPDDTAYLLYTSGSTGRPKGVPVPHRALTNLLFAMGSALGSGPADRWLNLTSPSFDICALEIFLPLVTGGRVVVASGVSAADGPAVLRLIRAEGVTHVQATPSGWRVLLAAGLDTPVVAVAGGEALPVPLARELRSRVRRLINGYGPTEATIYATLAELPPDPEEVTIGRPIPNLRAYLLDDELRPVPVGVPGELHLGGIGLADGYLNQPELTAVRFIPDPFGGPGERLYRTGDRCRWLPEGRIAFLGRADGQVKIRGHRVELGEIEARLLEHPDVAQAAVLLRDAATDEERLVGYVVPRGDAPDPTGLRGHLARTLPAVMVPTAWVILDRLPLTATGKVDRRSLPAPLRPSAPSTGVEFGGVAPDAAVAGQTGIVDGAGQAGSVDGAGQAGSVDGAGQAGSVDGAGQAGGAAGGDQIAEQIRIIWQDVLQIPEIGLNEDLFDLGGHSLTITRISGRIQQRLGIEVPLEVFFDTPTIAEVADFVRATLRHGGGA